jgi:hypothetical protein
MNTLTAILLIVAVAAIVFLALLALCLHILIVIERSLAGYAEDDHEMISGRMP